jgi:hypothetical protein
MADTPGTAASAAALSPTEARIRVGQQEEQIRHMRDEIAQLQTENANLTQRVQNGGSTTRGGWLRGLFLVFAIFLLGVLAGFLGGTAWGLRLQADCFSSDYFGRTQYICLTAEGLRFTEVPPPADVTSAPAPTEPKVEEPIEDTSSGTDTPASVTTVPLVAPSSDEEADSEEPAEIVKVNGDEDIEGTRILAEPPKEDPCPVEFIDDLGKYFDYRDWDEDHIALIEEKLRRPPDEDSPIHYGDYEFLGDDGPNLRAFIRDQRFGILDHEVFIVYASETVRYTIFRCECGVTAIYREIRVVYEPPPRKRRPPPEDPPSDEIPNAYCIDPDTRTRKVCV